MATPSTTLSTQRPDLASLMQFDLEASWQGFIGYEMFPVQNVGRQAGSFGVLELGQLLQKQDTSRAPGSGYSRSTHTFTKMSYATEENGHEEPVDDRERHMYAGYYDQLSVATMRCYDAVLRNAEERVAEACTAIASTLGVSSGAWSDPASTPVADVKAGKIAVRNATGLEVNALQVEWETFLDLASNPNVLDNLKGQNFQDARPGTLSKQAIALALGIERLIVSGAGSMVNTANPAQDASLAPLWEPTEAILAVIATDNDIRKPCIGRTFHWGGEGIYNDGSRIGGTVETYREEAVRGDVVRVRHDVDEVTIYEQCAIRITGVK